MSPLDEFDRAYMKAIEAREQLSAREAAEAAWYPGHPLKTVEAKMETLTPDIRRKIFGENARRLYRL